MVNVVIVKKNATFIAFTAETFEDGMALAAKEMMYKNSLLDDESPVFIGTQIGLEMHQYTMGECVNESKLQTTISGRRSGRGK